MKGDEGLGGEKSKKHRVKEKQLAGRWCAGGTLGLMASKYLFSIMEAMTDNLGSFTKMYT